MAAQIHNSKTAHELLCFILARVLMLPPSLNWRIKVHQWHVILMAIPLFAKGVVEVSLGFQQVKIGERGGRRCDFNDTGVNTRQAIAHVKESKTGLLIFNLFPHIHGMSGHELTCAFFFLFRNKWCCHSVDSKLLPNCVPPSVGSVSVPRGLSATNWFPAFAICSALSAWSARNS